MKEPGQFKFMTTISLSGLVDHCTALNLPRQHVGMLYQKLIGSWQQAHPMQPTGAPQTPFLVLFIGTLHMLRNGMTLQKSAGIAGTSKSTLGDYYKEIMAMIGALGVLQADGTWLTAQGLQEWLEEMKESGELVLVDGTFTGCPKHKSWGTQKVFYDSKHKTHAYNTLLVTTAHGDILAVHGGWPGSITEAEQLRFSGFTPALVNSRVMIITDRGFRAARADLGVVCAAGNHKTPKSGDAEITRTRPENERGVSLLKNYKIMARTTLSWVTHHVAAAAVAVLVGVQIYGHRAAEWVA